MGRHGQHGGSVKGCGVTAGNSWRRDICCKGEERELFNSDQRHAHTHTPEIRVQLQL